MQKGVCTQHFISFQTSKWGMSGWCQEPSVCPLDQVCFFCYDPGVWFLFRHSNLIICCYAAPPSCGEHLPQSFWNSSVLQSPQWILAMPTANRKTVKNNHRKNNEESFHGFSTRQKSSVFTYCPASAPWHRKQGGMPVLDPTPFQASQWCSCSYTLPAQSLALASHSSHAPIA